MRRIPRKAVALLTSLLVVLSFAATVYLVPRLTLGGEEPFVEWMPTFDVPGEDAYFVYTVRPELSHVVLYHGLGDSVANAKQADVLFLGNSRAQAGLREGVIVEKAREAGLRVYSLALGHAEKVAFALELIREHDLRPKVVVAVGGPQFYRDGMTDHAADVVSMSKWQARKRWWEGTWGWSLQRLVHAWIPKVGWRGQDLASSWVVYRSEDTGWWRPVTETKRRVPVRQEREWATYDQILPNVKELYDELRARDSLLLLTMVPYSRTQSGHLAYFRDELDVPAILPPAEGLVTTDGSHLARESGERYARLFWDRFISNPEVRQRLGRTPLPSRSKRASRVGLAKTRAAVLELRSMLEDYYGGADVLRDTWYLPADDGRYVDGVGYLADKLARALLWQDRFVIGAVGSSVVAGYDNCFEDTYQKQLERLMEPVWRAAGVHFEVRNTGQGGDCGDDFRNQLWCLRTLVGDDVDMTHYSWTYFEAGTPAEQLQSYHEMFLRWSLLMERGPVPLLLYANDCAGLSDEDDDLLDTYGRFGANVLCMERGLKKAGYPGKQRGVVGDTLHDTTRAGEALPVGSERRDSLGVVFRNWHPGPLLYQTTADALAYQLSDALLLALDRLAEETAPAVRWPRKPRMMGTRALPDPVACPVAWCGRSVPKCVNFEKPTFGKPAFRRLDATDPKNKLRRFATRTDASWLEWESRYQTRLVPEAERDRPGCRHPSRCAGLVAPAGEQAGWLTFELPRLELGFVAVCCSRRCVAKRCSTLAPSFASMGSRWPSRPRPLDKSKCVQVMPRFARRPGRPKTVQLGIRLPPREEPIPAITHVLGL